MLSDPGEFSFQILNRNLTPSADLPQVLADNTRNLDLVLIQHICNRALPVSVQKT